MRAQRLGGMRVQVEGESMRAQRLGGMRVQVEGESMRAQRLGWDEGTNGEKEYEGP